MAKIDGHVKAHPLVAGFPIETALRHLANDPKNRPDLRETAKSVLVHGDPQGLWVLHDLLHEHENADGTFGHPLKDKYNWMSAADKVQLDARTHQALKAVVEEEKTHMPSFSLSPESLARSIANRQRSTALGPTAWYEAVKSRVKRMSPHSDDAAVDESLARHAYRARRKYMEDTNIPTDTMDERALRHPDDKDNPRSADYETEKATRYRRLPVKRCVIQFMRNDPFVGWISPEGERYPVNHENGQTHEGWARDNFGEPESGRQADKLLQDGWIRVTDSNTIQVHDITHPTTRRNLRSYLEELHPDSELILESAIGKLGRVNTVEDAIKRLGGRRTYKRSSPIKYALSNRSSYIDALRRIKSSNQRAMHEAALRVARSIGMEPTRVFNAVHDTPHGSVPGVAQAVYGNVSPEALHAAASWLALTSNAPGTAVFHPRPTGPDRLYRLRIEGSGLDARHRLDQLGLVNRIIVPSRKGQDVLIPDPGSRLAPRVEEFADRHKLPVEESRGHFHVIGSADQAAARDKFRNVITKQENTGNRQLTRASGTCNLPVRVIRISNGGRVHMARVPKTATHPHHASLFSVVHPSYVTDDVRNLARQVYGSTRQEDEAAARQRMREELTASGEDLPEMRVNPATGELEEATEAGGRDWQFDDRGRAIRARNPQPELLPILADALQDAGFSDEPLLQRFRNWSTNNNVHVRSLSDWEYGSTPSLYGSTGVVRQLAYSTPEEMLSRFNESLPRQREKLQEEADAKEYADTHRKLVGDSGLPLGYHVRRKGGGRSGMRGNPPPGEIWYRPAYQSGQWYHKAQEKSGRKLTLAEMKQMLKDRAALAKQKRIEEKNRKAQEKAVSRNPEFQQPPVYGGNTPDRLDRN